MKTELVAENMQEEAKALYPVINKKLTLIAKDLGFDIADKDHNIKTKGSIIQKINIQGLHFDDALRFTFISDTNSYVQKVSQLLHYIKNKGMWITRFRNAWIENTTTYMGINMSIQYGTYVFELQIHTPESRDFRGGIDHDRYKKIQSGKLDMPEILKLKEASLRDYSKIKVPENIDILTLDYMKHVK